MWPWRKSVLDHEVVLTGWDCTFGHRPDPLYGTIVAEAEAKWFVVALQTPIVVGGSERHQLRVMARHVGHPLTKMFAGLIRRLLLEASFPSWMAAPLVAVNVEAEPGQPLAIGCIYLRSVWELMPHTDAPGRQ